MARTDDDCREPMTPRKRAALTAFARMGAGLEAPPEGVVLGLLRDATADAPVGAGAITPCSCEEVECYRAALRWIASSTLASPVALRGIAQDALDAVRGEWEDHDHGCPCEDCCDRAAGHYGSDGSMAGGDS